VYILYLICCFPRKVIHCITHADIHVAGEQLKQGCQCEGVFITSAMKQLGRRSALCMINVACEGKRQLITTKVKIGCWHMVFFYRSSIKSKPPKQDLSCHATCLLRMRASHYHCLWSIRRPFQQVSVYTRHYRYVKGMTQPTLKLMVCLIYTCWSP
jgi:hypothetical protein